MSRVFKIKYRNSWNAYISRSNIVGHNQNRTGTYWIMDSINGRATGVPLVTVRGLDQRTEDHSQSLVTQDRNHPLLDSLEQDSPTVGIRTNRPHSRIKGTSRQGYTSSCLGMTHLTLLHLPCFSHSRLMRLEAAITFRGHVT